jgi:hypothetical protein
MTALHAEHFGRCFRNTGVMSMCLKRRHGCGSESNYNRTLKRSLSTTNFWAVLGSVCKPSDASAASANQQHQRGPEPRVVDSQILECAQANRRVPPDGESQDEEEDGEDCKSQHAEQRTFQYPHICDSFVRIARSLARNSNAGYVPLS